MMLPTQTRPVVRSSRTLGSRAIGAIGAIWPAIAPPAQQEPVLRPPAPFPMGPVAAGIVDPCTATCAGSADPRCWSTCRARSSPWF